MVVKGPFELFKKPRDPIEPKDEIWPFRDGDVHDFVNDLLNAVMDYDVTFL